MPYYLKSNDGIIIIDENGALKIPAGTSATRPSISDLGYIRYNTNSNDLEYYNGSIWKSFTSVILSAGTGLYLEKTGDNMSGILGIVSGTNIAPGLKFVDDDDTGLFSKGSNNLTITTGGNETAEFSQNEILLFKKTGINYKNTNAELEVNSTDPEILSLKRTAYDSNTGIFWKSDLPNTYELIIKNNNSALTNIYFDIDVKPASATQQAIIRLFKNTSANPTTFEIYKGDGTPQRTFLLQQGYGYINTYGGNFGLGTSMPAEPLDVGVSSLFSKRVDFNEGMHITTPDETVIPIDIGPTIANDVFIKLTHATTSGNVQILMENATKSARLALVSSYGALRIYLSGDRILDYTNNFTTFYIPILAEDRAKFRDYVAYEHVYLALVSSNSAITTPVTIIGSAHSGITIDFPNDLDNGTVVYIVNQSINDVQLSSVGFIPYDPSFTNVNIVLSSHTSKKFLFDRFRNAWFEL